MYQSFMERRATPGAALDVTNPDNIPARFNLVFKADSTHIPCHVIWRQQERIGVAFD